MDGRTAKNYSLIFKNILNYLPSRILIILNSIVIIPLFAHTLCEKDMSIYLIALQILNLILTCSFDWITKAVLRFHEKFRIKNEINSFISSIFWISIFAYILIFLLYFLLKDVVQTKFTVDNLTFLITIFLIIPCGIRQFLYQILRIKNNYKLYNLSIMLYQFSFVILFFILLKLYTGAYAILTAMNTAIFLIDLYILKSITLDYKIEFFIKKSIVTEILKYALPLIFTNSCYWFILNVSKLIFQNMQEYLNTAIIGTSWLLSNSIIQPLMTVFIFASFPVIVKKFELKRLFKSYFTNIVQLYCFVLIPLVGTFCYYSKEITTIILPQNYGPAWILLPFLIISAFLHEFTKLINIKYHLKISTYIEMFLAGIIAYIAYFININLISNYSVLGAAIAMFVTELILISTNILIGFRNLDYLNYKKVSKTLISMALIGISSFSLLSFLFGNIDDNFVTNITQIILFTCINFIIGILFKDKILS